MSVLASQKGLILLGFFGGPLETRTPDPLIKSQCPHVYADTDRLARLDVLELLDNGRLISRRAATSGIVPSLTFCASSGFAFFDLGGGAQLALEDFVLTQPRRGCRAWVYPGILGKLRTPSARIAQAGALEV